MVAPRSGVFRSADVSLLPLSRQPHAHSAATSTNRVVTGSPSLLDRHLREPGRLRLERKAIVSVHVVRMRVRGESGLPEVVEVGPSHAGVAHTAGRRPPHRVLEPMVAPAGEEVALLLRAGLLGGLRIIKDIIEPTGRVAD